MTPNQVCHYCADGHAMKEAGFPSLEKRQSPARIVMHDKRGCYWLCWKHAEWRQTTSAIGGHSVDCPHANEASPPIKDLAQQIGLRARVSFGGAALAVTPEAVAGCSFTRWVEGKLSEQRSDLPLKNMAELNAACRNVGVDIENCDACAEVFFTGASMHEHTKGCRFSPADGADFEIVPLSPKGERFARDFAGKDLVNMAEVAKHPGMARHFSRQIRDEVLEFMREFQPEMVNEGPPKVPESKIVRLRLQLVLEEALEMLTACGPKDAGFRAQIHNIENAVAAALCLVADEHVDMTEFADACADIDYVVEGARICFGINGGSIAAEVHRSNMSKKGGCRRADGKWEKPDTYSRADVFGQLLLQGWKPPLADLLAYAKTTRGDVSPTERLLQRIDWAYGQLAASTNHKPAREAFKTLAIDEGLSEEQFEAWANTKKWEKE